MPSQACPASAPSVLVVIASYSGAIPSTTSVRTAPRTCRTWYGIVSVSMETATRVPVRSARIFGESGNVPSTISVPFQWKPMGTIRGVPSDQT